MKLKWSLIASAFAFMASSPQAHANEPGKLGPPNFSIIVAEINLVTMPEPQVYRWAEVSTIPFPAPFGWRCDLEKIDYTKAAPESAAFYSGRMSCKHGEVSAATVVMCEAGQSDSATLIIEDGGLIEDGGRREFMLHLMCGQK